MFDCTNLWTLNDQDIAEDIVKMIIGEALGQFDSLGKRLNPECVIDFQRDELLGIKALT